MTSSTIIKKNALFNVLRLGASSIVALLLPPFLVHSLSQEKYATWALILQLSAYVGLFDAGVQTAIGYFVAHTTEQEEIEERQQIISTAFLFLLSASVLALILLGIAAFSLPALFPSMPISLRSESRLALLVLGGSFAVGLPISLIGGIFIGLQRNEVPVLVAIASKIVGALATLVVVLRNGTLAEMASAMAFANLVSYALQVWLWKRLRPDIQVSISVASRRAARKLYDYCSALSVWTLGMLFVSGLDTTIVGAFDFKATAFYAIAATLTNFIMALQNAIFSAMLPAASVLHSKEDANSLGRMLISSTKYGTLTLAATGFPLIFAAQPILTLWVGADYAIHSRLILQILVIANMIRLLGLPYATLVLGTGQQKLLISTAAAEAVVNLSASIVAVKLVGAVGVALGTLLGSSVSIVLHFFYNMPRTNAIVVRRWQLFFQSIALPVAATLPATLAATLYLYFIHIQFGWRLALLTLGTLATSIIMSRLGLFRIRTQG